MTAITVFSRNSKITVITAITIIIAITVITAMGGTGMDWEELVGVMGTWGGTGRERERTWDSGRDWEGLWGHPVFAITVTLVIAVISVITVIWMTAAVYVKLRYHGNIW